MNYDDGLSTDQMTPKPIPTAGDFTSWPSRFELSHPAAGASQGIDG